MDDDSVYLGVWTNYSNGTVMGATLTTTRRYGNLLIAFTGFLIPFVASRFWYIACFCLHRYYSTPNSRDALHHQRQVVLRNSSSPDSSIISFWGLLRAWRNTANLKDTKRYSRLLPIILLTICCSAAFTIAAGFSSQISTAAGDVVLLKGDNCGIVLVSSSAVNSSITLSSYKYESTVMNDAANYAQQCYSQNTSGILSCNKFVVSTIPTASSNTNADCPFDGSICRSNTSNLRLDTGFIDSNDVLGLNAPEDKRFAWRYVLQCAPLVTQGYTSQFTAQNQTWVGYQYGNTDNSLTTNTDYIYAINDVESQYSLGVQAQSGGNYKLSSVRATIYDGAAIDPQGFTPIPQLFRTDADITVAFLVGNGVLHLQSLDDEWYRATVFSEDIGGMSYTAGDTTVNTLPAYMPSEAASPLGCTEQWQWCNSAYPRETGCGPLASRLDAMYGAASLFNLTAADMNASDPSTSTGANLMWPALIQTVNTVDITGVIADLAAKSLASQSLYNGGVQYPLPLNQWQLDVTNWWHIILASNQAMYVNSVVGTTDPDLLAITLSPNAQEQRLCNSQKILSNTHTSFNLFGLLFTYILGAIIIIISFVLDPFVKFLHDRYKYKNYEYLEWTTNSTLQLHRLAQEEHDMDTWSGASENVPITKRGTMLASLDITDLKHPVLATRSVSTPVEEVKPQKTSQHSGYSPVVETLAGDDLSSDDDGRARLGRYGGE